MTISAGRLRSLLVAATVAAACGGTDGEDRPDDAVRADSPAPDTLIHSRLPGSRGLRGAIHTREAVEARSATLDSLAAADR